MSELRKVWLFFIRYHDTSRVRYYDADKLTERNKEDLLKFSVKGEGSILELDDLYQDQECDEFPGDNVDALIPREQILGQPIIIEKQFRFKHE